MLSTCVVPSLVLRALMHYLFACACFVRYLALRPEIIIFCSVRVCVVGFRGKIKHIQTNTILVILMYRYVANHTAPTDRQ